MAKWLADTDLEDQSLYEECVENLQFNKHELDFVIQHHSELYFKAGERVARYTSIRDEAKKRVEEAYALVSLQIRDDASTSGKKLTEDVVKQLTLLDDSYQEAVSTYLKAKWEADVWEVLQESYHARGYMIRDMAELWQANYFSSDSHVSDVPRPASPLHEAQSSYEEQRAKLAEGRKAHKGIMARRTPQV